MKKCLQIIIVALSIILMGSIALAQDYEVRMTNFEQTSEFEFEFDIEIRNVTVTWAYNASNFQIDINTNTFADGQLSQVYMTVDNTNSDLPTNQQLGGAASDFFYSSDNTALATNSPSTGGGDLLLLLTQETDGPVWYTIGRFKVQLRNGNGGFQNWSDADPEFLFRIDDTIITTVPFYDANLETNRARRGDGNENNPGTAVPLSKTQEGLIIDVPDRQLAGYVFTGTENWSTPANWNQALKAVQESYTQSPPGASNNAIIAGIATVADTRTVNELIIAEGGALNVAPEGRLKTGVLYNDNQVPDPDKLRSGDLLARWGFDDTTHPAGTAYPADEANVLNENIAEYMSDPPYVWRAPDNAARIDPPLEGNTHYINLNTTGYKDLILSYDMRMQEDEDPHNATIIIEARLDEGSWESVGAAFDIVGTSWIEYNDVSLGANYNDKAGVQIRWRIVSVDSDAERWDIRNIRINGTPDIPSLLIESSTSNQGQLIHDGVGIEAVVEQYIPESDWVMPTKGDTKLLTPADWYWIASPVTGQNIEAWLDAALGEGNHNSTNVDLYRWDEPEAIWRNYHGDNFVHVNFERGHGYLYAAKDASATYIYDGVMHVGDLELTLTQQGANFEGWNLVGNSFASGLLVDATLWDSEFAELQPSFYVEPGGDKDNGNGGSYDVYKQDEVIPPMRAFFVLTNADNASLIIDKDARTMYNGPTKHANENYISLLAQPVEGNTGQRAYVRIAPGTSEGYDHRYDATFRAGIAPRFYSVKQNHNLIVNAVPELHEDLVIPYAFHKNNEGDNFRISMLDGIDGWQLYLKDLKLDLRHKLTHDNPYVFISQANDHPMRFELHFSPVEDDDPTSIDDPTTSSGLGNAWTYGESLYVHSTEDGMQVNVFDISGRQVRSYVASTGQQAFQHALPAGIYMVRLTGQYQTKTVKVVVR